MIVNTANKLPVFSCGTDSAVYHAAEESKSFYVRERQLESFVKGIVRLRMPLSFLLNISFMQSVLCMWMEITMKKKK